MSDFYSGGWSIFIATVVILGMAGCLWLLISAARGKVVSTDETTGHVWDENLRELNNPLPRWWMWLFVITIVFSAVYLAFYPGLGSSPGVFNWSSRGQYEAEQEKARAAMAPLYARFATLPAAELAKDAQAMGIGERLFVNNCAACHGSDARGNKGFPNLTDNDWLYGGTHEIIKETITRGRQGTMPPIAAAVGSPEDVRNVAHYVLSLSGSPHDAAAAQKGQAKFGVCAGCHGPDGKGMQAIGSANLTDKTWLHGFGEEAIMAMINHGKVSVMPAQATRFTPEQIHVLAAYVWNLSQTSAVASN